MAMRVRPQILRVRANLHTCPLQDDVPRMERDLSNNGFRSARAKRTEAKAKDNSIQIVILKRRLACVMEKDLKTHSL